MGLAQDIVIVNEFSVPSPDGGGTRGSTPGAYVTRYMARDAAVEPLSPVRQTPLDDFVTRYMLRDKAVESYPTSKRGAKAEMARAEGLGGRAFGRDGSLAVPDISLSDQDCRDLSKHIQALFDAGHTALKTVISFSVDYMKEMGVVSPTFVHEERGDWAGNVDQARLRSAVISGMDRLSSRFDDLVWIGCIQTDASMVHCHLCMADEGVGRVRYDGMQSGKLIEADKLAVRQGIEADLERTRAMTHFSSDILADRQNVQSYLKSLLLSNLVDHSIPQLLVACLPKDRSLWQSSSMDLQMQKADAIVRSYVEELLLDPKSGWEAAERQIYLDAARAARERDLGVDGEQLFVKSQRQSLFDECVDAVYDVLKTIPEAEKTVSSNLLDAMVVDLSQLEDVRKSDPMMEFSLKLRTYSSRLRHHRQERKRMDDGAKAWEAASAQNQVDPASRALYEFYLFERDYNAELVAKYLHFLQFPLHDVDYEADVAEWEAMEERTRSVEAMVEDANIQAQPTEEAARTYVREHYGRNDGAIAKSAPETLRLTAASLRERTDAFGKALRREMGDFGLVLEMQDDGHVDVRQGALHDFDEVKFLDLHHMDYDFVEDAHIARIYIERFAEVAEERSRLLDAAVDYLQQTDQAALVETLPVADVESMKAHVRRLRANNVIGGSGGMGALTRGHSTVSLDADLDAPIADAVRESIFEHLRDL